MVFRPLVAPHDLLLGGGPGRIRRVDTNQNVLEDAIGVNVHFGDLGETRRGRHGLAGMRGSGPAVGPVSLDQSRKAPMRGGGL